MITNITRLNGVSADYGYDPIGQLVTAQAFESGGAPRLNEQFGYAYDASHNLAYRTNNTLLQSFTSNSRNELANAVRAGTLTVSGSVTGAVASVGVNGKRAEIYSDQTFATTNGLTLNDGNNLFVTVGTNTGGTLVLSTKVATKLPATVNFSYDLNGNLLSDGLKGFEYDDANQLVSVTVTNQWKAEFVYDGLGRRRKTLDYAWSGSSWNLTNEVRYVWDGMCVLQERDGANAVQVTYTRGLDLSGTMQGAGGIGGLLARTDSSGSTFYHSDGGGNITAMTDSSGNVVARYLYDPFGNLLAKSGAMADVNRYRFSSKEMHPNSGLYYYGYRFYEPNLQRWVNEDPLREEGGMNLHGFVGNNPMNYVDPFGHGLFSCDISQKEWDRLSKMEGAAPPQPGSDELDQLLDQAMRSGRYGTSATEAQWLKTADHAKEVGMEVPKGIVTTATMIPVGGERAVLAAGEKGLGALQKSKTGENVIAHNVAELEKLKDALRAQMSRPHTSGANAELEAMAAKLYREKATVGSGSTAAAVREELRTGLPIGNSFHRQKAEDAIKNLQKWLGKNPDACTTDRAAAENMIKDMQNALNGK